MSFSHKQTCIVAGCDRRRRGHGYCSMHWKRWKRNGTPHLHRPVAESLPGEEWRLIPGTEGIYAASNLGRIKREGHHLGVIGRTWPGKLIEGSTNQDGYLVMRPYRRPDRRTVAIHRLVALTFLGPCPEGLEVNHIDGNRTNNAVSNLEYVTHHENVLHAWEHGDICRKGENNNRAKLTEDDVRAIRAAYEAGASTRVLAKQYGLNQSAIWRAVSRKSWKHVE